MRANERGKRSMAETTLVVDDVAYRVHDDGSDTPSCLVEFNLDPYWIVMIHFTDDLSIEILDIVPTDEHDIVAGGLTMRTMRKLKIGGAQRAAMLAFRADQGPHNDHD
jgi:hypothetical protein